MAQLLRPDQALPGLGHQGAAAAAGAPLPRQRISGAGIKIIQIIFHQLLYISQMKLVSRYKLLVSVVSVYGLILGKRLLDKVEDAVLLDVIIRESHPVLERPVWLVIKDEFLLISWDTFFLLDHSLDISDGVCSLHIKADGLATESLH